MSLQKIQSWLENPDRKYDEGLSLYDKFKTDSKRDAFFRKGESSMSKNMLFSELTRLLRIRAHENPVEVKEKAVELPQISLNKNTTPAAIRKALAVKIDGDTPIVNFKDLPDELKSKYNEIKSLTKVLAEDYALLTKDGLTNDDRKDVAERICKNFDLRKDNWVEIDTWAKGQEFDKKQKEPKKALTADDIKKQIKIKKDNIVRAGKNMTDKNKKKVELSISKWENEIEALEQLLLKPQNASK